MTIGELITELGIKAAVLPQGYQTQVFAWLATQPEGLAVFRPESVQQGFIPAHGTIVTLNLEKP